MNKIAYFETNNIDVLNIFRDFAFLKDSDLGGDTEKFVQSGLGKFILYSVVIFISSAVLGIFSSKLLRAFNLDRKYKIFRFRNQWYYIFSGAVLKFQKFESARGLHYNNLPENQEILMTFADIMVNNQQGVRELYTGYVVDYDLKQNDISKLDKIYLLDAYRYKKGSNSSNYYSSSNYIITQTNYHNNINLNSSEIKSGTRERVGIPGDMLVIEGENVVNINLTYIPSKAIEDDKEARKQKKFKMAYLALAVINILFVVLHAIGEFIDFEKTSWLYEYYDTNLWGKIFVIFFSNQILLPFFPIKNEKKKYTFDWKVAILRFVILILMSIPFVIFINKGYIKLNFW
ncbi:hypothetical protein QYS49_39405 [Marivirga salinae]|uniref:Uncharacterized protein n=1 Tax=Marivirga salinarum TaxID=3059078 RepID=A0AA51NDQ3_9BACT|nr:hypothetical protein [Marivirga sp. BDSF4-3]WMN11726.1 hypothetical protein QYS49_39405 [Marivirga sp. BDSF4-3]